MTNEDDTGAPTRTTPPPTWVLREGGCLLSASADGLPLDMPAGMTAELTEEAQLELTLYDTWPCALWHSGRALIGDGAVVRLLDLKLPSQPRVAVPGSSPEPLAWDQPAALAAQTAARQKLRAVLPQTTFELTQRWWALRNEDDKIVVRLLEQSWGEHTRTVQVVSLRGYGEEAQAVIKTVPRKNRVKAHPLTLALERSPWLPRVWSNKPSFLMPPARKARPVAIEMLRTLLTLARDTEAGIVADYDTEFVHDYRVLIRRARSALSVIKGVFSPEATADLKARFRALGQATNKIRDLDVHLLARAEHEARVPEWMRPGLTALFEDLQRERDLVHAALVERLRGEAYQAEVAALDTAIAQAAPGPKAKRRIRDIADKRIHAALRRVIQEGRAIDTQTPDEAVHELRISAKKLRYTLEFFRPLYQDMTIDKVIKKLKRLQDILGHFNDLSVQQDALRQWSIDQRRLQRQTSMSVGALIGALAAEQTEVRSHVEETFARFNDERLTRWIVTMTGKAPEVSA